jgi:hypothetical protein
MKVIKESLILVFFILTTIFTTWPLVLNLGKFYSNLSPADYDTPQFVFRVHYYKNSIKNREFPLTITKYFYPDGINPLTETIIPTYSFLGGVLGILTDLDEIVIHNLISIFFVFLSCVSIYYLIVELTKNKVAALMGGVVLLSSNYILNEMIMGHPDTIQVFWITFVFILIEKIIKSSKLIHGIILGLVLSLTFLSSLEYFLYLSFIIPLYLIFRSPKIFYDKKFFKAIVIAFLVFLLSSGWYMKFFINGNYRKRLIEENLYFSVKNIESLRNVVSPVFLFTAFCGLIISLREKMKFILPFSVIGVFSLVYALGPFSKFAPQYFFLQYWPYVNAFRTPYRMVTFFIISISVFTSIFVQKIHKKNKSLTYVLMFFCIILIHFSQTQNFKPSYFYDYPRERIEFYKNISKITGNFSIVEYPNKFNCWYVYHIIFHTKNLIGGCAADDPQSYRLFNQKCGELTNISEDCIEEIKKLNLTYAIYHSEFYPNWNEIYQILNSSKFLVLEANSENLFMFKLKIS